MSWNGPNIVVFNDVIIKPPYKLENVSGHTDSRRLNYVKKMVERLTKDRSGGATNVATNSHPSLALIQSQPLPQRRNSNGNTINQSQSSSHSSMAQQSTKSTSISSNPNNIKAN